MSARTPSRERAIGAALVADPLLAEAVAGYAEADGRTESNAVLCALTLGLRDLGWISYTPDGWAAGPRLEIHRRRGDPAAAGGIVVPFLPWERAGGRS